MRPDAVISSSTRPPAGWRLGLAMFWRDARAGELRLLLLGLIIAVAAVTSVGFLAYRVGRALERDAGQMMVADLKIDSDHAPAAQYTHEALKRGLSAITTVQFPSMASAGDI